MISIPGISLLTAMVFVSDYADIRRFSSSKKFTSYLRTGMTVAASNEKCHVGHVNKQSRKASLNMLLQKLHHTWQHESPTMKFRERKKSERKNNGKIRIAIARKIITAMYYMLRDRKPYKYLIETNYNTKLKELKKHTG